MLFQYLAIAQEEWQHFGSEYGILPERLFAIHDVSSLTGAIVAIPTQHLLENDDPDTIVYVP